MANSFIDSILPTVGALAPTVASALGGPLAGMAVNAIESALGVPQGSSQTADGQAKITQAIGALDPATAAAMRKADEDFQEQLKQLDIDLAKINEQDIESARTMQIQTKDVTPRLLAIAVTLGFFGLLALMAFHTMPAANQNVLDIMLGALGAAFTGVIHFYFGSSSGSQGKDATIQAAVTAKK